jgi:hypothetical protein
MGSIASDLVDYSFISNRIIHLYFDDGYVDHYGLNQSKKDDITYNNPLDTALARKITSFVLTSNEDEDYSNQVYPIHIGRKSKGNDFSGNSGEGFPVVLEHNLYLEFEKELKPGYSYTLFFPGLASNTDTIHFKYNPLFSRSESVKANQVAYSSNAPVKLGYLSAWLGDMGPMEFEEFSGNEFHLVRLRDSSIVFTGIIQKRKDLEEGGPDVYTDNYTTCIHPLPGVQQPFPYSLMQQWPGSQVEIPSGCLIYTQIVISF